MSGTTDVAAAVQRAVATGERVPIMADGRVVGYISAPNKPLPPGPCCDEHAAALRRRVAELEASLRACCEAVETEKTCRECGGVTSFTDGDEDGVVARHRDDCEFGAARALLEGAEPGRVAELESALKYHRKTICSCYGDYVCLACQLLDGEAR